MLIRCSLTLERRLSGAGVESAPQRNDAAALVVADASTEIAPTALGSLGDSGELTMPPPLADPRLGLRHGGLIYGAPSSASSLRLLKWTTWRYACWLIRQSWSVNHTTSMPLADA